MTWNGLLGFWIAFGVFALWFVVMFWGMPRAILRELRPERAAAGIASAVPPARSLLA